MPDLLNIDGALAGFVLGGLLLLTRLSALLVMLPGFRRNGLPLRFRIGISLMIMLIMNIALGGVHVPVPTDMLTPVLMFTREFLLGTTMGMAIRLLLGALQAAGAAASYSMALSMNVYVDPTSGDQSLSLGSLFSLAGGLIFIALDGHHLVLKTFFAHMHHFPVGPTTFYIPSIQVIALAGSELCMTAFLLASPVIVVALAINIGLAFVMRVVPSVNIFGIGLSLLLLGGLLALGLEGDAVIQTVDHAMEKLPKTMVDLSGAHPLLK